MTRRNRVDPAGDIHAVPERGLFFGNRGCLHDADGRIVRPFAGKRWILCVLAFKGRKRPLMQPGRFTELFFLDEATALAAGHRPCVECRRERFLAFRDAWMFGNRPAGEPPFSAKAIDEYLHAERVGPYRSHRVHLAEMDDLPDGVFVHLDRAYWLVRGDAIRAWSPGGYGERRERPTGRQVVLTPASTVAALRVGYVPVVHPSADSGP